jgi:hypothetical protein
MRRFLLKNLSVQTTSKLVKDKPADGSSDTTIVDEDALFAGPEVAAAYSEVAKDFIGYTAVVVGATYCICKIVGRICK